MVNDRKRRKELFSILGQGSQKGRRQCQLSFTPLSLPGCGGGGKGISPKACVVSGTALSAFRYYKGGAIGMDSVSLGYS
tara:strand:- start:66 stop:302 length:237 start_codon:yes stop_codon:yes gene_type:complete